MPEDNGLISDELAAKLLMITTAELAQLARRGIVTPAIKTPAKYRLVEVVQAYLRHLQAEPTRPRTQSEAAKHLGITARQLRNLIADGVIERRARDYDLATVRKQYCDYLINLAKDRGSSPGLTAERAALAREQREAAQIKNSLRRSDYVSVAEVKRQLAPLLQETRERIMSIPGKLGDRLAHRKREEVEEILEDEVIAALNELASPRPFDGGPDRTRQG